MSCVFGTHSHAIVISHIQIPEKKSEKNHFSNDEYSNHFEAGGKCLYFYPCQKAGPSLADEDINDEPRKEKMTSFENNTSEVEDSR